MSRNLRACNGYRGSRLAVVNCMATSKCGSVGNMRGSWQAEPDEALQLQWAHVAPMAWLQDHKGINRSLRQRTHEQMRGKQVVWNSIFHCWPRPSKTG